MKKLLEHSEDGGFFSIGKGRFIVYCIISDYYIDDGLDLSKIFRLSLFSDRFDPNAFLRSLPDLRSSLDLLSGI